MDWREMYWDFNSSRSLTYSAFLCVERLFSISVTYDGMIPCKFLIILTMVATKYNWKWKLSMPHTAFCFGFGTMDIHVERASSPKIVCQIMHEGVCESFLQHAHLTIIFTGPDYTLQGKGLDVHTFHSSPSTTNWKESQYPSKSTTSHSVSKELKFVDSALLIALPHRPYLNRILHSELVEVSNGFIWEFPKWCSENKLSSSSIRSILWQFKAHQKFQRIVSDFLIPWRGYKSHIRISNSLPQTGVRFRWW